MSALATPLDVNFAISRPPLTLRTTHSRPDVASIWQRLECRLRNTGLTNSWAWTDCWLNTYGSSIPHWFVIAERHGHPVGVALVTRGRGQKRGPLPVRTVHLGTAGERPGDGVTVEYNRLLVEPASRASFLSLILGDPGIRRWSTDVLQLDGFAPEELVGAPGTILRRSEQTCFSAMLTPGGPDVIETFDGQIRRKIRKNLKRFTESFGPLDLEWVTDTERAQVVMTELVARHQARWTSAGMPGSFASGRFQQFHRAIVDRLVPDGRIVLCRVTAGETLVGIFYGFIESGVVYHYQWGLGQFDDNSLSPGFVTGYLVMEAARARGLTELNWLAGDTRYKREMSNTTRTLVWGELGLSPWYAAVNGMITIKQGVRGRNSCRG